MEKDEENRIIQKFSGIKLSDNILNISNDLKRVSDYYVPDNIKNFVLLHIAASQGKNKLVSFALLQGASIDPQDIENKTPLYYALAHGHQETAMLLIEKGADITIPSNEGICPLHIIAAKKMVNVLSQIKRKIDVENLKDINGDTPFDYSDNDEQTNRLLMSISINSIK